MEIEILFEDENYIAVNKPAPLLVHKTPGDKDHFNLMNYIKKQTGHYLYPIHRLDKQVSGAIIFGLNQNAVRKIKDIWHTDLVKKEYIGLVKGLIERGDKFTFSLNDKNKVLKEAITIYNPIRSYQDSTLVDIEIQTGRYHQIRRHFSRRMQHIIGDRKYGKKPINDQYRDSYGLQRVFLHSKRLSFENPFTHEKLVINAPLTHDLKEVLNKMESITLS